MLGCERADAAFMGAGVLQYSLCCDTRAVVDCCGLPQAQEGLILALEDSELLLLDGNVHTSILSTGKSL